MKHKFTFDKASGTMVPDSPAVAQGLKANVQREVQEIKPNATTEAPTFRETKKMEAKSAANVNVRQNQVVQMKRIDKPSAVQLVDEHGVPEAYLDSITTGVVMFRERQDYSIYQITDDKTGKILAYIGGYALQINFNMDELKTMERIEQCLEGLKKLFRHQIMHQPLNNQ